MKVLFLTTILPSQQRVGTEVASQAFIDGLRQNGCQVSVVGYMRKGDYFEIGSNEILVEKRYIETKTAKWHSLIWLILSFVFKLPYSAAKYYSRAYVRLVKSKLNSKQYHVVVIDHSQLAWLVKLVDKKSKVIFIPHNIEHELYLSHLKGTSNFLKQWIYSREAQLVKKMEMELSKNSTEVWALTEHDATYFSSLEGANKVRVLALPPGPAKPTNQPIEKVFDIGLIGNWMWKFNEEGLRWFLNSVYPDLPSNLSVHVAGKGADWLKGKYSNVIYEGFVPNAQVFMAQAKVVVLPMRDGGGIQIKTLDAIASGSVIVATPTSLRGISSPLPSIKVAEQPDEFAQQIIAALHSLEVSQIENSTDMVSNWLKLRKKSFLTDIACAISLT